MLGQYFEHCQYDGCSLTSVWILSQLCDSLIGNIDVNSADLAWTLRHPVSCNSSCSEERSDIELPPEVTSDQAVICKRGSIIDTIAPHTEQKCLGSP